MTLLTDAECMRREQNQLTTVWVPRLQRFPHPLYGGHVWHQGREECRGFYNCAAPGEQNPPPTVTEVYVESPWNLSNSLGWPIELGGHRSSLMSQHQPGLCFRQPSWRRGRWGERKQRKLSQGMMTPSRATLYFENGAGWVGRPLRLWSAARLQCQTHFCVEYSSSLGFELRFLPVVYNKTWNEQYKPITHYWKPPVSTKLPGRLSPFNDQDVSYMQNLAWLPAIGAELETIGAHRGRCRAFG